MNAREITTALVGRWHGHYGMVKCPTHHPDTEPSLKISDGENDVIVHCFAGCPWQDVKAALRRDGLLPELDSGTAPRPDPEALVRRIAEQEAEERRRVEAARHLWRAACPVARDDQAGHYLTSRGLHGPWPPSLRMLPAAPHPSRTTVPALIAAACRWPARAPRAVQLTALTLAGGKAGLEPLRWTRGVLTGAAVRFAPWNKGKVIVVVEGIEDGLAVLRVMPEAAPWAVLGVLNAKKVVLPSAAEIVLALDGDDAGKRAAKEAADTHTARGHQVKVAALPGGADPADLLTPMPGRAA